MPVQPWCNEGDLFGPFENLDPEPSSEDKVRAIALASEILYGLTGERWPGVQQGRDRPLSGIPCRCSGRSVCPGVLQQELAGSPVLAIAEVKVGGVVIDPARYEVQDGRWLTALRAHADDGDFLSWPACQRVDLPDTELGTWSVTYTFGAPPTPAGATMAAVLAGDLLIAWAPDQDGVACRLSSAFTSITRAGLSVTKPGIDAIISLGATGIRELDLWVASVRIGAAKRPAALFVPGQPPPVRHTRR